MVEIAQYIKSLPSTSPHSVMVNSLLQLSQTFFRQHLEQHHAGPMYPLPGQPNFALGSNAIECILHSNARIFLNDQLVTVEEYKNQVFTQIPHLVTKPIWNGRYAVEVFQNPDSLPADQLGLIGGSVTLMRKLDPMLYDNNSIEIPREIEKTMIFFTMKFEQFPDEPDIVTLLAGDKRRISELRHLAKPVNRTEVNEVLGVISVNADIDVHTT